MAASDSPFARRSGHLRRSLHANIRQRRGRRDAGGAQHGLGDDRLEPVLTVFPRCLARDGGHAGPMTVVADNPAHWTSNTAASSRPSSASARRTGSTSAASPRTCSILLAADYGPRDAAKPGVQAALWAQYALDNAATVEEALAEAGRQIQTAQGRDRGARAETDGTDPSRARGRHRRLGDSSNIIDGKLARSITAASSAS